LAKKAERKEANTITRMLKTSEKSQAGVKAEK